MPGPRYPTHKRMNALLPKLYDLRREFTPAGGTSDPTPEKPLLRQALMQTDARRECTGYIFRAEIDPTLPGTDITEEVTAWMNGKTTRSLVIALARYFCLHGRKEDTDHGN